MKISRAILLAMIGVAALCIIILAVLVRVGLENGTVDLSASRLQAAQRYTATSYEFDGIRKVLATGNWRVSISDTADNIVVSYPENIADYLIVEEKNHVLVLSLESNVQIDGLNKLNAVVPVGRVTEIAGSGAIEVDLGDISFDELTIQVSGGSHVTSDGGEIGSLALTTSGATNVDLSSNAVGEAYVKSSGAGSVALRMDGGSLTGSLSGAVVLNYYGDTSSTNIETSGLSKVNHR